MTNNLDNIENNDYSKYFLYSCAIALNEIKLYQCSHNFEQFS